MWIPVLRHWHWLPVGEYVSFKHWVAQLWQRWIDRRLDSTPYDRRWSNSWDCLPSWPWSLPQLANLCFSLQQGRNLTYQWLIVMLVSIDKALFEANSIPVPQAWGSFPCFSQMYLAIVSTYRRNWLAWFAGYSSAPMWSIFESNQGANSSQTVFMKSYVSVLFKFR